MQQTWMHDEDVCGCGRRRNIIRSRPRVIEVSTVHTHHSLPSQLRTQLVLLLVQFRFPFEFCVCMLSQPRISRPSSVLSFLVFLSLDRLSLSCKSLLLDCTRSMQEDRYAVCKACACHTTIVVKCEHVPIMFVEIRCYKKSRSSSLSFGSDRWSL